MGAKPKLITGIKAKLIAWWHGYDPPAILGLQEYRSRFLLWWNGFSGKPERQPASGDSVHARTAILPRRKQQEINSRGIVSQALWGVGNLTPGPAGFITDLTARLGLTSEMSMLDLGAGLGGPSRAISEAYGIWVTAYEAVAEYVKAGMEQSVMHGMAKKVPIAQFDSETITLPKRKYDCVFSKEIMHHVEVKERLITEIESALKIGGQFFIMNYVITGKGENSPLVTAWSEADGKQNHFWTKEQYSEAFKAANLDLRVSEDLTERYCEIIAEGFRGLRKNMDDLLATETDATKQAELRRALAFESKRWAVRAEALQGGAIAVVRFSGTTSSQTGIR